MGEFAGPELVDDQTVMVWLWRKLLFVCQPANDVVVCMHTTDREVEVVGGEVSALRTGVQDSCTCTSVSRKVFLLGGGGVSQCSKIAMRDRTLRVDPRTE